MRFAALEGGQAGSNAHAHTIYVINAHGFAGTIRKKLPEHEQMNYEFDLVAAMNKSTFYLTLSFLYFHEFKSL